MNHILLLVGAIEQLLTKCDLSVDGFLAGVIMNLIPNLII